MKNLPKIIGHRGARNLYRENTLESFAKAIELGVYGIEFDVRLTKDCVPVVIHDEEIKLSTGETLFIGKTDLKTLNSLEETAHIPTLTDTLDFLKPYPIQLIIEIKHQEILKHYTAQIVGNELKKFHFQKQPIISTSNLELLSKLKKTHPSIPRAFIITIAVFSFLQAALFAKVYGITEAHVRLSGLDKKFVNTCKKYGLQSYVWTANKPIDILKACSLGIDGMMTDDIVTTQKVLDLFKE